MVNRLVVNGCEAHVVKKGSVAVRSKIGEAELGWTGHKVIDHDFSLERHEGIAALHRKLLAENTAEIDANCVEQRPANRTTKIKAQLVDTGHKVKSLLGDERTSRRMVKIDHEAVDSRWKQAARADKIDASTDHVPLLKVAIVGNVARRIGWHRFGFEIVRERDEPREHLARTGSDNRGCKQKCLDHCPALQSREARVRYLRPNQSMRQRIGQVNQ